MIPLDLVPVARELSEAVVMAQYPPFPTIVKKCAVRSDSHCPSEGIETLDSAPKERHPTFWSFLLRYLIIFFSRLTYKNKPGYPEVFYWQT